MIALYHMLKNGELYHPRIVHPDAERKHKERAINRLIAQLEKLGHSVTLQTATAQAGVAP
ncbi:MAG TPA: hypothetical protein VNR42_07265 [Solirubrobacteraceae bacterium]|nr:hypothetical protein [Solirubrobacteraceae bacterium]